MTDIILETFLAIAVIGIFIYLWLVGKKENIHHQEGWHYILAGFAAILFGMLLDITDNFPVLSQYIILGDTGYQAILEKIFGYLLGFILLAIGFWKWMPTIVQLKEARRELNQTNDLLESKVIERTASLEHEIEVRSQVETQLRHQEKLKGVIEMAGGVCHELNQPLQILLGYSEMLMVDLEEDHPDRQKMASIVEQVDRMKTITQRLMSVTRYETIEYLDNTIIDINRASDMASVPP
jgi:signal transduction histidine kinase